MIIEHLSVRPEAVRATGAGLARPTGRAVVPPGNTSPSGAFVPTDDFARLLQEVRNLPEERPGVVADAVRRLTTGEVASPTAAGPTAEAILDGLEPW